MDVVLVKPYNVLRKLECGLSSSVSASFFALTHCSPPLHPPLPLLSSTLSCLHLFRCTTTASKSLASGYLSSSRQSSPSPPPFWPQPPLPALSNLPPLSLSPWSHPTLPICCPSPSPPFSYPPSHPPSLSGRAFALVPRTFYFIFALHCSAFTSLTAGFLPSLPSTVPPPPRSHSLSPLPAVSSPHLFRYGRPDRHHHGCLPGHGLSPLNRQPQPLRVNLGIIRPAACSSLLSAPPSFPPPSLLDTPS